MQYLTYMKGSSEERSNFKDLFSSNNLKLSIILFTLWYIVSYVYYGLIYILPSIYQELALTKNNTEHVDYKMYEHIIADIIFSCIFEIPSNISNGILPNIIGRKTTILIGFIGSFIFSTLCWFSSYSIPFHSSIAKALINTAFNVLYVYTSEAYPTYMRSTALGTCNFFSRIGGFTTPFINQKLLRIHILLPFVSFALTSFLGLVLTLLLDETYGTSSY